MFPASSARAIPHTGSIPDGSGRNESLCLDYAGAVGKAAAAAGYSRAHIREQSQLCVVLRDVFVGGGQMAAKHIDIQTVEQIR